MRAAFVAVLLAATVSGCAVLADKRTAAACQVADGVTTKQALDRGAVEANPVLGGMSGNRILNLKILFAALLLYVLPERETASGFERFAIGTLSVVGCGAAIHNHGVQR